MRKKKEKILFLISLFTLLITHTKKLIVQLPFKSIQTFKQKKMNLICKYLFFNV